MAYTTLTRLTLTEAQRTSYTAYITSETTAGNTDGVAIPQVERNGVNDDTGQPLPLIQRSWKDSASANAFITFCNGLTGAVEYAVVVDPL